MAYNLLADSLYISSPTSLFLTMDCPKYKAGQVQYRNSAQTESRYTNTENCLFSTQCPKDRQEVLISMKHVNQGAKEMKVIETDLKNCT